MAGLEDLIGKFMTDDLMKALAEGVKEGVQQGQSECSTEETWCHVNGDKPVKNWLVLRCSGVGTCDFSKTVAVYKKHLAPFLKALPEGQGAIFLPASMSVEVTPGGN